MSDIGFRVQGSKAYVIRGENEKEIPRDSILEIYQLVLGHVAPNRDYSSVTSIRKLLHIIDLECEPDESEDEDEPVAKPARGRKPAARTVRKTAPKAEPKESSEDDSDDSDDDSDE